jgi:hypothetical protein
MVEDLVRVAGTVFNRRRPLLMTRLYVRTETGLPGDVGAFREVGIAVAGSGRIKWATFSVLDHTKPGSYSRPAG